MQKEMISARQMLCVIVMFIFGSSLIIGVSSEAAQDSWISLLVAVVFVIPAILIYARIIKLYPEKDLFEIAEILFGKIIGKIIIILMSWYALHLGALVLRNFSEFLHISIISETPELPIMFVMIFVVVYMAKSGIETMGKWSIIMLSVIIFLVILTILFSITKMDFTNIMPVFENDFGKIATSAFQIFSFPFAETVLFLCLGSAIKKQDSPNKLYMYALFFASVVLLLIILRNLFVLGPEMIGVNYYASFIAARVIHVAKFLPRMEGFIAVNFILAGIIKITVCLIAASKGTARLFGIRNYREILLPISLLMVALCAIVYKNVMEMFSFLDTYKYYAIPFQIIIPVVIWISAEVRRKKESTA